MQTIANAIADGLARATTTAESPTNDAPQFVPSFDAWHPSISAAAAKVVKFADDMRRGANPYWLTLSGLQGAGKTMLARQAYQYAAKHCNPGRHSLWIGGNGIYSENNRRPRCVWFTAAEFKDQMLGGDYSLPEYLRQDYLVVIDDLGTARDTKGDAVADGLYRLADNRVGRWMIWTTNLTLNEIDERIDRRVSSRMIRDDNRFCTINCGDYSLHRAA